MQDKTYLYELSLDGETWLKQWLTPEAARQAEHKGFVVRSTGDKGSFLRRKTRKR